MVSRLMFSLKKVVNQQAGPWNLSTMGAPGGGRSQEGGALSFAPRRFDTSHGTLGTLGLSSGGIVELDSVPRSPQDHGSQ